jgi:hypothetical protein
MNGEPAARPTGSFGNVYGNTGFGDSSINTDTVVLATAAAIYLKAFVETLGKNNAEALIKAVRPRFRHKGKTVEIVVGAEHNAAAATIIVTKDTPDEARLALLDLDVTSQELRGKELRWDSASSAWLPSQAHPTKPDKGTPSD